MMEKPPAQPHAGARILVVDDEAMLRKTTTRALNLMGYQAEEADLGEAALRKMASCGYDLVLLDLRMPGVDGVEVMRRATHTCPDTLIIVLTAHATLQSAIAAVRYGAVDYLLKPYSLRETGAAIERALENRQRKMSQFAGPSGRFLQAGPLTLDIEKHVAILNSEKSTPPRSVELTTTEAALLAHLIHSPSVVYSCSELAQQVLGYDVPAWQANELVRPHISRLRAKIEVNPQNPALICTVHGKGYFFSLR